uniref:Uncharacterized protein n=1 Tax=Tetraselmis sp. GSL018 TaxID=582737 RepID=A0A061SDQ1_9CHLO
MAGCCSVAWQSLRYTVLYSVCHSQLGDSILTAMPRSCVTAVPRRLQRTKMVDRELRYRTCFPGSVTASSWG